MAVVVSGTGFASELEAETGTSVVAADAVAVLAWDTLADKEPEAVDSW